jgi:polysaccharide biosynthesis protein PslH
MATQLVESTGSATDLARETPTVLIVGPPWPRSGTARVIQNQIDFYRSRGYTTVFICVPVHCSFTEDYAEWNQIKDGIQELGADRVFVAPIDQRRFLREKYVGWIEHGFRGTALDWIVVTARSARLSKDALRGICEMPIVLMNVNHVFTFRFALGLLRQVVPAANRVPVILDTHDVQAHLLAERQEINPWTHRVDSVKRLLKSELSLLEKSEVLVHCSVEDFNFFKPLLPYKQQVLALPSIDETFVSTVEASRPAACPIDLLFVGQSTDPNRAAMKWFFTEVWPLICDRGYRITIVGQVDMSVRESHPEIYREFRSSFVGPVEQLAPFYRAARCVFAPMISGTGVSIKTIEALALGKPFIGTSKAYRGMPMDRLAEAGIEPYDTPRGFADAIVHALSESNTAAVASRTAYDRIFSRKSAFTSREEVLRCVGIA